MAIAAAKKAGEAILKIYESKNFDIRIKDDNSPLTKADKEAHKIIITKLEETGLPILSEEGADIPFKTRKNWKSFWMVDPLDGTKEFIKRNGEFTVNIALIENRVPVFGVVYAPVLDKLYYGGKNIGAFLFEKSRTSSLISKKMSGDKVTIVASRSHLNEETQKFINQFDSVETITMGSSLKFMVLAEGKADYYPRFAPTMEWDTAAAQAIVTEMAFTVSELKTQKPLVYNKKNLLNPSFLVS